jgi:hypothetical protein
MNKNLQNIYNNHLVASRKCRNKPFRIRKNFDKFDEDKGDILKRLDMMFRSYPTIDPNDFFSAPFLTYEDDDNFPLEFFLTQKAKKIYSQYMKTREMESPDSLDSLERLRDGLSFVFKFCSENNLTLEEYPVYCRENVPDMLNHLKSHQINFYVLHALEISKVNLEPRLLDFMFGDFYITFQKTRNMFKTSSKMSQLSKLIINKLNKKYER